VGREKAAHLAAMVKPHMPGMFNRLLSDTPTLVTKTVESGVHTKYAELADKLVKHFGVDRLSIDRRSTLAALQLIDNPTVKVASETTFDNDAVSQAALDYARYKLAFAEAATDPFVLHMSVLQDYVT
jgi:carboxylesterase type B